MLDKLDNLKIYGSGLFTARQNELAILDMTLYSDEVPKNIEDLDKKTLEIVNKYSCFKKPDDYKMYC
jgi:Zn-dependent oligopeptidase